MTVSEVTFEQVLKLARRLTPAEQALAETPAPTPAEARIEVRGLLAELGPAPSAEEIDAARREMWASFPRDES